MKGYHYFSLALRRSGLVPMVYHRFGGIAMGRPPNPINKHQKPKLPPGEHTILARVDRQLGQLKPDEQLRVMAYLNQKVKSITNAYAAQQESAA
jgi:hypothetical protein